MTLLARRVDRDSRGIAVLGSINRDLSLRIAHLPRDGETLHAASDNVFVRQPYRELAAAAVEGVLAPPDSAPLRIQMEAELVIRRSCGRHLPGNLGSAEPAPP